MGNAFLYRMPAGIPGDLSRASQATVESAPFDAGAPFAVYGVPAKIVNGKLQPVGSGDTAAKIYGFLVRAYPVTSGGSTTYQLGVSVPPTKGMADVMRRGYMTVKLNAGAAALNSQVYVRVSAATSDKPLGGIEAAADGVNTVAITGCTFMCVADESGNVEIAYNI